MPAIRHHKITVEGLGVFVREAGDPDRPTLVLLPGYPSSTRAYVRLIDRLAPDWHAVAIDYPGFGSSDPLPESPTFDRLAEITGHDHRHARHRRLRHLHVRLRFPGRVPHRPRA